MRDGADYRAAGGFTFQIDNRDPFQATMLFGLYDPIVERIVSRYTTPGGIAIDAGAHLGYFSLRLARLVGRDGAVHAFECDPRLIPRLKRHAEINGLSWLTVNACGLLDVEKDAELYLPDQLGWSSTIKDAWGATQSTNVRMTTIDHYVAERGIDPERLSFIKLDVEGAELLALRGASSVLRQTSAPVLIEYLPERMGQLGQQPEELEGLMAEHGYVPWSPDRLRRGEVRLHPGLSPRIGEDVLFLKGPPL